MPKHRYIIGSPDRCYIPCTRSYSPIITPRGFLKGWRAHFYGGEKALPALPPRTVSAPNAEIDFLIYTDASNEGESGGIGAIVIGRFNFTHRRNRVGTISEAPAPVSVIGRFSQSSIIFGLEMAAVGWTIFSTGGRLGGKNVLLLSIITHPSAVLRAQRRELRWPTNS